MKKSKPIKRVGMLLLAMCLLWLGGCKRNELQPPRPSVLGSYRGTDKIVLQVVEELKKPDNKTLLADLEKQGSVNWSYQALITSRFMDGITLRFATGSNGDYLDAEVNAQTRAINLYSKQQQEQRDAMSQQAFGKRLQGNGTQAGVCSFKMSFEVAASGNLNLSESLEGIAGIKAFFIAEGFTSANMNIISLAKQGYNVVFEARNNETEAQVRSLLDNALTAYCESRNIDRSSWVILKLKTTNSCDDDGPVLVQTIPPITWMPASPVISYQAVSSYIDPLPFLLSVTPFKENGFWKLKIRSLTGSVSMHIFTGGYRDPDSDPPVTAGQANDAINYMSAYFMRGSAQGWHTTAATLAHENYHYTEIKAIGDHYWQQAAACINGIKVPASGNDAADEILAKNMADQVIIVFSNTCNTYHGTLSDGAGGRPYAAGQLELNKTITWIKQRADSNNWWTTGTTTIPNVDINNPTYQPFMPFYCPY